MESHAKHTGQPVGVREREPESSPRRSEAEAKPDELRGFFHHARQAAMGPHYFTRYWLPILGCEAYALVQVLRSYCYFNPETGELRNECFPELETLARKMGISRSTLCRLLKRDAEGLFIRKREDGSFERWALNLFLRVEPQYLERKQGGDERQRWKVRTSNRYYVAMDDPVAPGDEERVAAREQELLGHWQKQQAEEEQREARRNEALRRAGLLTSECQNDTQSAVSKWHSESCLKMTQESLLINTTSTHNFDRSMADLSIRNDKPRQVAKERTLVGGSEQRSPGCHEKETTPRRSLAQAGDLREPGSQISPEETAAEEAAKQLAKNLLIEWGAEAPEVGSATILEALREAGAPPEGLMALIHLGAARVAEKRKQPDAHIDNVAGYFIATMRRLALEARGKRWDIQQLRQAAASHRRRSARSAPTIAGDEEPTSVPVEEEPTPPTVAEEETDEERAERLAAAEAERAWVEHLQPTVIDREGRQREVAMLWGFVRDALAPELNTARRHCVRSLLPAADPDTQHLVLLTTSSYTARQAKNALLHQIEEERQRRLAGYFEAVRVEQVARLPAWAEEGHADGADAHGVCAPVERQAS